MSDLPENFTNVPHFENYSVSNFGNVMNNKTGKKLRPYTDGEYKHRVVTLYAKGRSAEVFEVAELVMQLHGPAKPSDRHVIAHRNKKLSCNHVRNLFWKDPARSSAKKRKIFVYMKHDDDRYEVHQVCSKEDTQTLRTLPQNCRKFYCLKGFSPDSDGLKRFADKLLDWSIELQKESFIDYTWYYGHPSAVLGVFEKLSLADLRDVHEPICRDEFLWSEQCFNGGLVYCQPQTVQTHSYDAKSFYPWLLAKTDLKIPVRPGREVLLSRLPKKKHRKVGYYRVDIVSDHPDVRKLFSFSPNGVYCNYSIDYAFQLKKRYPEFNLRVQLVTEGVEANAYLYEVEDVVNTSPLFEAWFDKLMQARQALPNNALVKVLLTTLWGLLNEGNCISVSRQTLMTLNVGHKTSRSADYFIKDDSLNNDQYKLQSLTAPLKRNYRIKSFLTAVARNAVAKVAESDLDNVVRVYTDSVSFSEPQDLSEFPNFIPEDKTSGYIEWQSSRTFSKLAQD